MGEHKHYAVYTTHVPQLEVPVKEVLLYVLLVFQDFQRCTDECFFCCVGYTFENMHILSIQSLTKNESDVEKVNENVCMH